MDDSVELQDLSTPPERPELPRSFEEDDVANSVVSIWSWVTASLYVLAPNRSQASCLVLFPRLLLFISETASPYERRSALTSLESFLALHFGIWLAAVALALVLNIPSSPAIVTKQKSSVTSDHPLLGPLTVASNITAFLSYNTSDIGPLASIVCTGSALIGLWGLWTIVFGDSSLVSKKTGADKHTSSFIFGNKKAASAQKKQWMKEQKRKRI